MNWLILPTMTSQFSCIWNKKEVYNWVGFSPTNILGSPFPVISSSLKSPALPSLGFGSISSSQVRRPCKEIMFHGLVWIHLFVPLLSFFRPFLVVAHEMADMSVSLWLWSVFRFPNSHQHQECTQLAAQKISSLRLAWGPCQLTVPDWWCLRNACVSFVETVLLVGQGFTRLYFLYILPR